MANRDIPIELTPDQSANRGECGSCKFFRRVDSGNSKSGTCEFRFPEKVKRAIRLARTPDHPEIDEGYPTTMDDTDGCDLWRSADAAYVQKRYWNA